MPNPLRKPASGQDDGAPCRAPDNPPKGGFNRRSAFTLALAGMSGAAALTLPARARAADPDKLLRWHGEQLEEAFKAYEAATRAFYEFAASINVTQQVYLPWALGENTSERAAYKRLSRLKEAHWDAVAVAAGMVTQQPVHTLQGLAVKARAIEIEAFGIATTRCQILGRQWIEAETGYWPAHRMRAFADDVIRVAGAGHG